MAAAVTDKFKKAGASTVTSLAAPGKAIGATSITVGSTTNYPLDTGVVVAIRVVDTAGALVAGTYTEWNAIVTSATSFTLDPTPVHGSDQVYAAGSSTQVYISVSSSAHNQLVDGLLEEHNQDGTHGAVTATSVTTTGAVVAGNGLTVTGAVSLPAGSLETADYANASITNAKLATTAGEIGGAWTTWTPTLTNITLGNGTVVAKYSQVGKTVKYKLSFTMGTTSAMGSVPKFTLPVTAAAIAGTSNGIVIGRGSIWDFGTNNFDAVVLYETTTLAIVRVLNAASINVVQSNISSTNPMTWASTDEIHVSGEYEAA